MIREPIDSEGRHSPDEYQKCAQQAETDAQVKEFLDGGGNISILPAGESAMPNLSQWVRGMKSEI